MVADSVGTNYNPFLEIELHMPSKRKGLPFAQWPFQPQAYPQDIILSSGTSSDNNKQYVYTMLSTMEPWPPGATIIQTVIFFLSALLDQSSLDMCHTALDIPFSRM